MRAIWACVRAVALVRGGGGHETSVPILVTCRPKHKRVYLAVVYFLPLKSGVCFGFPCQSSRLFENADPPPHHVVYSESYYGAYYESYCESYYESSCESHYESYP